MEVNIWIDEIIMNIPPPPAPVQLSGLSVNDPHIQAHEIKPEPLPKTGLKRTRNAYNMFVAAQRKTVLEELMKKAQEDPEWLEKQKQILTIKMTAKNELRKNKDGTTKANEVIDSSVHIGQSRVLFSLTTNELAARWNKCREEGGPEYEKYAAAAAIDKARFHQEKIDAMPIEVRERCKKVDQPLNVRSAYNFFLQSQMKSKKNPSVSNTTKRLASVWNAMNEEERQPFINMMNKDRERFKAETEVWKAKQPLLNKKEKKDRKKRRLNAGGPKKAQIAYLFFVAEQRPILMELHKGKSFGDLSKIVGQKYRSLTPEEKEKYIRMHEADKKRYATEKELWEQEKQAMAGELHVAKLGQAM